MALSYRVIVFNDISVLGDDTQLPVQRVVGSERRGHDDSLSRGPEAIGGPGWAFGYGGAVLTDPAAAQSPQSPGTFSWGGVWVTTGSSSHLISLDKNMARPAPLRAPPVPAID